jgi:hypothetical protein
VIIKTIVMIKLATQVFLCANGITRINGGNKELAFALLAACHGGNFALISQDDEVALCHGADSLSQFRWLRHDKELRPKLSQLSRTGLSAQTNVIGLDECIGDYSLIEVRSPHRVRRSDHSLFFNRLLTWG